MRTLEPPGAGPPGDDEEDEGYPEGYVLEEPTAERRLRRSLLLEVLDQHRHPRRDRAARERRTRRELDTGPFAGTLNAKQVSFDVTDQSREPRRQRDAPLHADAGAVRPSDPTDVSAELSQSANNIAPIKVDLIRLGPGHYTSTGFTVPFAGSWQLTVKAVVNSVDEVTRHRDGPDPLVGRHRETGAS